MTHKIFNASNVFGAIAFFAMIGSVAAYEGGMYITSLALAIILAVSADLSIWEDGKRK